MLPERLWFLSAVIIYGLGLLYSIFIWRRGFQYNNWTSYALIFIAFIMHTMALTTRGVSLQQYPVNNLYEVTTFILWTISLSSLICGLWTRLRYIGVFTAPLLFSVGVFAMMPGLDQPYGDEPNFTNGWKSLHVALIMLGYGAFGLSAITGSMFLTQDRNLKIHRTSAIFSMLPPIQRLEKLITYTLLIGLILLTGGISIAAVFIDLQDGMSFWNDSKVIWSLLVWGFYLALLIAHIKLDQRGKRYAWLSIIVFCFVIFTFWGTNLLSDIHNPK